jgi:hypothetical protein
MKSACNLPSLPISGMKVARHHQYIGRQSEALCYQSSKRYRSKCRLILEASALKKAGVAQPETPWGKYLWLTMAIK